MKEHISKKLIPYFIQLQIAYSQLMVYGKHKEWDGAKRKLKVINLLNKEILKRMKEMDESDFSFTENNVLKFELENIEELKNKLNGK